MTGPLRHIKSKAGIQLRRWRGLHSAVTWFRDRFGVAIGEGIIAFSRHFWRHNPHFGPPYSFHSVYKALRTGSPPLRGRIVLEDQGNPRVTEDSQMVKGGYYQHKEQPWPIFWSEHPNAELVATSLGLLFDDKHICVESVYGMGRWWTDPATRYFRLPPALHLAGNWTSIISRWTPVRAEACPNYTHWLLDALPRLALVEEFPADTKILIPPKLDRNQRESLEMLGLWERCRPTTETHLRVDTYYFSSFTTMLQGYNPYGVNWLRRTYLPKQDTRFSGPKKIFIQRRGLSRDPLNREEVEALFTQHGWTVLDLMQFSFAEKIKLFAEAEAVAGMFGSGFTNCIFCRPECEVMAIMPEDFGVDGYMEWIAQVVGFRWQPLLIAGSYDYRFAVNLEPIKTWLSSFQQRNLK